MLYSPHSTRRITIYIHQQHQWPHFIWEQTELAPLLASIHYHLGVLMGRMQSFGFDLRSEALLRTLTLDVVKSSEIENEKLDVDQVRSSIARRLGMDIGGLIPSDRVVEGTVEMMLDATQHFDQPLTQQRLYDWHAALFPTGHSGMRSIKVGVWRDDAQGSMQVVSGPVGRERVHYEAPPAAQIENEMTAFITWFNQKNDTDPLIKAGIAHFWFVTIHPFEDGNGRIARVIADMQLARTDKSRQRFYSMSSQLRKERSAYYDILEKTQKGGLDITAWLFWFLTCLNHAIESTEETLSDIIRRARFWEQHITIVFNERQKLMLIKLLDNFVGHLTTTKWAKITKCSQDTALRDIQDLIAKGILEQGTGGGRSTFYQLISYDSADKM